METNENRAPAPVPDAFATFVAETWRGTLRAVLPVVRDHGDAEDVAQVAYARAAACWHLVGGYQDPAGWVRRVAHNEAVSLVRGARRRRVRYVADVAELGGAHHDRYEHDAPDLVLALRRLPPRDGLVLSMRYLWNYSVAEIAEELAASPNTVKMRLARARKRLASQVPVQACGAGLPSVTR